MLPVEYERVPLKKLNKEVNRDVDISFEVTGVRVDTHTERTGRKFWLISLDVKCGYVDEFRKKMGLNTEVVFNPHITIFEKEIVR